jgi:hypothetical protein
MDGVYHIRVQPVNNPELVLAFPAGIAHLVEDLFQPQYRTGQDFLNALEQAKPSMLEAIAANFLLPEPSDGNAMGHSLPKRNFSYSIEEDKLALSLTIAPGPSGKIRHNITGNECLALYAAACLIPNYIRTKNAIDPDDGPIDVKGMYDEKTDNPYIDIGTPAIMELMSILSSLEQYLPQEEGSEAEPKVIWSKFIEFNPIFIHMQ